MIKRTLLAVLAGYSVWTILSLNGSAGIRAGWPAEFETFDGGAPITATSPLLVGVLLSVVCSLAAGLTTAAISSQRTSPAAPLLCLLLLATGVGVQASVWSLMPLWYHLAFLILLVPACLAGARIRKETPTFRRGFPKGGSGGSQEEPPS